MAFIRLTIQYSSTRNRPKNGLSSSISLLLWQLCILGREIKFSISWRSLQNSTRKDRKSASKNWTHVWRHKCIKGPICNNIGPTEIWCKYQYISYLRNKYSYSVQEDDGRINPFWRWRHFLIKYREITLNQHPLNTVYEWRSNSQIKQKNANDLSNYM